MSGDLKTGGEKTQRSLGRLGQAPPPPRPPPPPHGPKVRTHLPGVQGHPAVRGSSAPSFFQVCLGREGTRTLLSTLCGSQHGVMASYPHPKQAVTPGTFGDPFTFTSFST